MVISISPRLYGNDIGFGGSPRNGSCSRSPFRSRHEYVRAEVSGLSAHA
jgi:hypothetical protein